MYAAISFTYIGILVLKAHTILVAPYNPNRTANMDSIVEPIYTYNVVRKIAKATPIKPKPSDRTPT